MLTVSRKTLRYALTATALLVLLAFVYNGVSTLVSGPKITIHSPVDGSIVKSPLVEVTGVAQNISHITLNGASIFVDEEGAFESSLLVASGYNIIEVQARDRFGRDKLEKISIILK